MAKKKKKVVEEKPHGEDNQPQGDREQDHVVEDIQSIEDLTKKIDALENKSDETMGLVRDCIDVLKNYKVWLDDVDTQLAKIKSILGL